MSLECGECERDLRGGRHDQLCSHAMHYVFVPVGHIPVGPPACDVMSTLMLRITNDRESVSCVACIERMND